MSFECCGRFAPRTVCSSSKLLLCPCQQHGPMWLCTKHTHAFCTARDYRWNMWSHVAVHAFCCATLCKLATFPSGSLVSHGLSCSIDGKFTSSSHLSKRAIQKVVSSLAALIRMKRQLWSQTRDASDMWDSSLVKCTHSAVLSVAPCRCTVQKRLLKSSRSASD